MRESIRALLGSAITVAACYSLGSVLAGRLRLKLRRLERWPIHFLLGAVLMSALVFAILTLRIAYRPMFYLLPAASIGIRVWLKDPNLPGEDPAETGRSMMQKIARGLFAAIAAAFSFLYLADAWAPEISPDGSAYHLGLVARYLRAHGFEAVTTNFYASLSAGVEMLFVPAFSLGRHSAAALVHFAFLIALSVMIYAYGKRIGRPIAGAAAAVLVYVTPVVGADGTSAYIDVAAAAVVFGVFYLTRIWDEDRDPRILVAIGLLGGFCYAAKYTAAIITVYAIVFVIWRSRRLRPGMVVAGLAVLVAAPWVIRNWIVWQNPIAPFANSIFRNPYITPDFERGWLDGLRLYGLASYRLLPMDVTVHGVATGGIIGPFFLIAPIALIALRWREGRRLLLPAALLLSTYFSNIGARFLIPALPFVCLAMALVVERALPVLALLVVLHASLSWPKVLVRYSQTWVVPWLPYREALGLRSREAYLLQHPEYRQVRMIDRNVPAGERVLIYGDRLPDAYTSRDLLVSFQGALNNELGDMVSAGWAKAYQPDVAWVFSFPERAAERIRVVQTARMPRPDEQWNIHEMRFFDRSAELPRRPEWRLRAFPNPWGVQMAFDHAVATRWRSWETAGPGMYMDVDFGRSEKLDEVRLETSAGDQDLKMEVQEWDGERWSTVNAKFSEVAMTPAGSARRSAGQELRARGVHYVAVRDTDWGANSVAAAPEAWGMEIVARESGMTLYRVLP